MSAEPYIYFDGCENCAYNGQCGVYIFNEDTIDCPETLVDKFTQEQLCKKLY